MSTLENTTVPSLFQQLGGEDGIAAVVDDFYGRILADDALRTLFVEVDLDPLQRDQHCFLNFARCGPNRRTDCGMRATSAGLGITLAHFGAVAGHLSAALAAGGVPKLMIEQIIGQVATLQGEVGG